MCTWSAVCGAADMVRYQRCTDAAPLLLLRESVVPLVWRRGPRAPEETRVMGGVVKRRGGAADIGERGMQERVGGMWQYVGLLPAIWRRLWRPAF